MPRWTKDREHLFRMVALFAVGIAAFLAFRHFMVPEGFGAMGGHYRAGALADNMARPVSFAGREACLECHGEIPEMQQGSRHAGIQCEACHGPLATHANDPEQLPVRPDPVTVCLVCHVANAAKPKAFPQIDPATHMDGGPCNECHSPHHPENAPTEESQG